MVTVPQFGALNIVKTSPGLIKPPSEQVIVVDPTEAPNATPLSCPTPDVIVAIKGFEDAQAACEFIGDPIDMFPNPSTNVGIQLKAMVVPSVALVLKDT